MDTEFRGTVNWNDAGPWEEAGGMRWAQVQDVISAPDEMQAIDHAGMVARFFRKKQPGNLYSCHVACDHVGDELNVISALKIYDKTAERMAQRRPLAMLAAFLEAVDMNPIFLGDEAFRVIAAQTLTLEEAGKYSVGIGTDQGAGDCRTISRVRLSDDKSQLHVCYGWVMNFARYREYLIHNS